MSNKSRPTSPKIYVDLASVVVIMIFVVCPWWLYIVSLDIHNQSQTAIFLLIVLALDAIPFALSLIWLSLRYAKRLENTAVMRWRLYLLLPIILLLPFLLRRA